MNFSRKTEDRENDKDVKLSIKNNKKLSTPKLLWVHVTLGNKFKFQAHIEKIERKTLKALAASHIVGKSDQVSADYMVKLYWSLVLPYLEFAASVWQIRNCDRLNNQKTVLHYV